MRCNLEFGFDLKRSQGTCLSPEDIAYVGFTGEESMFWLESQTIRCNYGHFVFH